MATVSREQQSILDRFVEVSRAAPRLTGVALVGSHAAGTANVPSDIDLFLVAEDQDMANVIANRGAFPASSGQPLFVHSWGRPER
jgi:predicted nucleotidyltransferase